MRFFAPSVLPAALLAAAVLSAQDYTVDHFKLVSGAGASSDGLFAVSGTIRFAEAAPMSEGIYTVSGRFLSLTPGGPPTPASEIIFDNIDSDFSSLEYANPTTHLGNKFCTGEQSYQLDSVTVRLSNRSSPAVASLQLQIFSDDAARRTPSISVGPVMNLSGETNPITFPAVAGSLQKNITWTPATPFLLIANTCYWVVLSTESGEVLTSSSSIMPKGAAAAFGTSRSLNAGATWDAWGNQSNRKMLIRGTPAIQEGSGLNITALEIVGNELTLSFTAVAGRIYSIQSRADLGSGEWTTIPDSDTLGKGEIVRMKVVKLLSEPRRFYRLSERL